MRVSLMLAGTALVLGTGTALAQQEQPSGAAPPAAGQPAPQNGQATPADPSIGTTATPTDPAAASDPSASAATTEGTTDQKADKKKKHKKDAESQPPQ